MRWYTVASSLAVYSASVAAFKDTSPYLLLSTSKFPSTVQETSRQIQASSDVLENTKNFLITCPSDTYIIVSQPTLHADDLSSRAAPYLQKAMSNANMRTRIGISEVVGQVDPEYLKDYLVSNCQAGFISLDGSSSFDISGGKSLRPLVVRADFKPLPSAPAERVAQLAENDDQFRSLLDSRPSKNYTIIYTTTPVSTEIVDDLTYKPSFIEPLHMELKRFDDKPPSGTEKDDRALFQKYQFFTPGLFMGLLVVFILLAILSVGFTALGSLQVSYGAFDKEMGPAAQKKQQ